ncbi:dihydrofolate reductase family protein [Micromonospora ureilytica]|uniref:dihydrofolate reductase family protein n=1 Tax=Micromonospora ureilytica TaxID=709868 RepID=UPI0033CF8D9D
MSDVRQLLPSPHGEVDPYHAYDDLPPSAVRLNLVMTVDGSVGDHEQWTDSLGGAADFHVFRSLRALADGIMVGASTVRTGRVGPHRPTKILAARRVERGLPATAPIIVVSQSLQLDWSHRLFTEAVVPTVVVTSAAARRSVQTSDSVRIVTAGEDTIDLRSAVRHLQDDLGLRHLLCEGGPTLATAMLEEQLIDEFCLSLAPSLIGGQHHLQLLGNLRKRIDLQLAALYEADNTIFARYRLHWPHARDHRAASATDLR